VEIRIGRNVDVMNAQNAVNGTLQSGNMLLLAVKELFKKEIGLATTIEQLEAIRIAYLGKSGIIRQIEKALWS